MAGIELAHANEAEVREIGPPIGVSRGERGELGSDGDRCGWRMRRGTRYPQCPSRTREPLTGGQVPRALDRAGQPHERLPGAPGLGPLELVTNNLALGNASLRRDLLQPSRKLLGNTNGDRMAHMQNRSRARAPRQALAQDLVEEGRPDLLITVQRDRYGGPIAPPVPRAAPPGRPATTWTVRQPPRVRVSVENDHLDWNRVITSLLYSRTRVPRPMRPLTLSLSPGGEGIETAPSPSERERVG